jgi:hypothetical protein
MIARNKPAVRIGPVLNQTLLVKVVGILSVFTVLTVRFYARGPSDPYKIAALREAHLNGSGGSAWRLLQSISTPQRRSDHEDPH